MPLRSLSDGATTSAQSLKCVVVTTTVWLAAFRRMPGTRNQKPELTCVATATSSSFWPGGTAKMSATGASNRVPSGPSRYALPTPRGALFVISVTET